MDHGLDIERQVQKDLLRLARELGLPLVATNDLHYTKPEDAKAHSALLCVQSGSTLMDPNRFKFDADDFYLKSPAEMRHTWRELPEACDNTLLHRRDVRHLVHRGRGALHAPLPLPPRGERGDAGSSRRSQRGLRERFPERHPRLRAASRPSSRPTSSSARGMPATSSSSPTSSHWAKNNGIRVGPGRGSGAGSMCAYAMKITDLDPIPHGLIFERFLNPERPSLPDFDVDFDERRRGEVIRTSPRSTASERVAQIVTYGTIKAKQAVKDAARVMGHPFAVGEQLTKAMPPDVMGKGVPLSGIYDPDLPALRRGQGVPRPGRHPSRTCQEVVETAKGLEGLKRQWGVHAAGVIMCSEPLIDVIPIMRRAAGRPDHHPVRLPELRGARPGQDGLPRAAQPHHPRRRHRERQDATAARTSTSTRCRKDMTDRATYDLLGRGDTLGVFQLDGGGMRTLLELMQPDNFEDISAALALYRPGPMGVNSHTNFALRKNGKQEPRRSTRSRGQAQPR